MTIRSSDRIMVNVQLKRPFSKQDYDLLAEDAIGPLKDKEPWEHYNALLGWSALHTFGAYFSKYKCPIVEELEDPYRKELIQAMGPLLALIARNGTSYHEDLKLYLEEIFILIGRIAEKLRQRILDRPKSIWYDQCDLGLLEAIPIYANRALKIVQEMPIQLESGPFAGWHHSA